MGFDGVAPESILPRLTVGDGAMVVAFIDSIVITHILIRDAVFLSHFQGHFVGKPFHFIPRGTMKHSIDYIYINRGRIPRLRTADGMYNTARLVSQRGD